MQKIYAFMLLLLTVKAPANETLFQLKQEIGLASCKQSSECRLLALGAKACGGPEFYLPWSVREGKGARITALADRFREERLEQIKNSGELSVCQLLKPPGVGCIKQQCVLQSDPVE